MPEPQRYSVGLGGMQQANPGRGRDCGGTGIEVFLEGNKLFYRPVDSKENEGVLLYENS